MKHKLLSLLALAGAMTMSTSAMAWDYPTMPAAPAAPASFEGTWVTPEADGQYYIYNVGTGLFLGGGQTWGTRGIVLCDSVVLVSQDPVAINNVSNNTTANYVLPFELVTGVNDGEWYFNVMNNSKATSGAGHFVGEDGAQTWIDGDESRNTSFGTWTMEEKDGGYLIKNFYASESKYTEVPVAFGVDGNNIAAGWATTWTDLVVTSTETTQTRPYLIWKFVSANDGEAVKAYCKQYKEKAASEEYQAQLTAFQAAIAAYRAKFNLKTTLEEAEENGIDTEAAGAIYTSATSTAEQVNAAITSLQAAINRAKFAAEFVGTEDDPQDVTDLCLQNSDFSDGTINGWTTNYVSGQQANNIGYQYSAGTTNVTFVDKDGNTVTDLGYKNGDSYVSKFIEAWKSDADPWVIGDGYLQQTVPGLPKGKYVLHCDAIATYQWGNAAGSNPVKGVYLFVQAGSLEAKQAIATGNGQPEHFTVTFINDGSDELTFGLKTESSTANWIAADNFRIWFYGETEDSPELATLKEAIKRGEELAETVSQNNFDSTDDINVSEEARQALNSAIADGQSAADGSDAEAQLAAAQAIDAAIAAVNESKKLYKQFKAIYAEGDATLNKLADLNQWPDLQGQIEDFLEDDLRAKFDNGALTADMLEEYQNKVSQIVREYISDPSKIQEGDDLTFLLVNPGFTTGTTANPTGWTINSGSITELRAATHNIETYHAAFDLSQTLPNMPAGVYDVTLQGFARHDGADTDKTWLYGGISKEYLISLNDDEEQMRDTPIYSADNLETYPNLGDGNYDNTATNGMYKANGMTGAYHWFNTLNPNTGENYYVNHVKVVLDHDGDLTIGIHCETTSDWVIFSNFGIKYAGMDPAIFAEMVQKKQTELTTLVENIDAEYMGLAIADDVNKLVAEKLAIDANNIDNSDDALAAIAEIDETIKKVNDCAASYKQLGVVLEFFEARISETAHTPSEAYQTTVSKVRGNYDSGYAAADAIVADEKALVEGWAASLAGTYEAGEEITEAILNPTYDGYVLDDGVYGAEFWESTVNPGVNYNECEFFNTAFTHSQTLRGLTPGYYTVAVDGFYRYGDYNANTDAGTPGAGAAFMNGEEVLNVEMFVQSSTGSTSEPMKSIFAGTQPDLLGVGSEVSPEGVDGYIPNDMNAASTYLDYGSYENKIDVEVGEDGVLTIGVRKSQGIVNDWAIFKNWKLTYLGTEAPVAVEGIEAQTAGNSAIYSIDGRQQNQLRRGINIVRQNGKVEKVLVK